jgi:hypothetical protein
MVSPVDSDQVPQVNPKTRDGDLRHFESSGLKMKILTELTHLNDLLGPFADNYFYWHMSRLAVSNTSRQSGMIYNRGGAMLKRSSQTEIPADENEAMLTISPELDFTDFMPRSRALL